MSGRPRLACRKCKALCCKFIRIPLGEFEAIAAELDPKWLNARGVLWPDGSWRIRSRCRHLSIWNRCKIYARRPLSCDELYPVNGADCNRLREEIKDARKGKH